MQLHPLISGRFPNTGESHFLHFIFLAGLYYADFLLHLYGPSKIRTQLLFNLRKTGYSTYAGGRYPNAHPAIPTPGCWGEPKLVDF